MTTQDLLRVVHVERTDDIPVLLATLERLRIAELFDQHYPAHHLWKGELTPGEVLSVWLAFLLSTGDHRLYKLQPWAQAHLYTLQGCLNKNVYALDFQDDRLADLLEALPDDQRWQAFEADLNRQTLRVYDLKADLFRIDTTTANSYNSVLNEDGILQFGHSKGDSSLPQLKVSACALDPLGLPVTSVVVAGNVADDPLYIPEIQKVHQSFGQEGKLFVGDSKMGSLATRAYLVQSGDFYLCPLSEKQMSQQQRQDRLESVWQGEQELQPVYRPQEEGDDEEPELIAEGFFYDEEIEAELEEETLRWTERRWLVRSVAYAEGQQKKLHRRLDSAEVELEELTQRKQGKKRLDAVELQSCAEEVLERHRVVGLLGVGVRTQRHSRKVRGYGGKADRVKVDQEHHLEVSRDEEAIAEVERQQGWQVYGLNQVDASLEVVVRAYRGQYQIEKGWSRLKGKRLSLEPMYLQDETRMQGLVQFLMLAVRVLTLLEWQVRDKLKQTGEKLSGVYPGQAGRKTSRPSAELLLGCFEGISLTLLEVEGVRSLHVTGLTPVQIKLLALWDLPKGLYHKLTLQCAEPPPALGER